MTACSHPGVVVHNPSHFGKSGSVLAGLRCGSCGEYVHLELEPVTVPAYQQDVYRAMARMTGKTDWETCRFVKEGRWMS
jgi:hypothetical protein